jgi:hypothetical protein
MSILEKYKKNKHFISFSQNSMNENEEVLDVIEGFIGKMMGKGDDSQHNGLLICTNQKVCFHRKGFLSNISRSIPVKNISSIDLDKGIFLSKIVFHTSNDKIVLNCNFEDAKKLKLIVEKIRDENQESSTQNIEDPIEKIKKLKQLKDEGIITDQEFEEKKKILMDRI